jgi:hypothetical protein
VVFGEVGYQCISRPNLFRGPLTSIQPIIAGHRYQLSSAETLMRVASSGVKIHNHGSELPLRCRARAVQVTSRALAFDTKYGPGASRACLWGS